MTLWGGFVVNKLYVESWRGAFVLVRSCRPGVLSSFSATRLFLWKESGFWFAFGTKPFPPISEAWLSLLRGAVASCWGTGWRAGDGCSGAAPGALCLDSPWPAAFPSLSCSAFPLQVALPTCCVCSLARDSVALQPKQKTMEGHSFHPPGMEGLLCAFHSW